MSKGQTKEQLRKSQVMEEFLNPYLSRRIKFLQITQQSEDLSNVDFKIINSQSLQVLATISQTEKGVDYILENNIEGQLEIYLKDDYLNSKEQDLATLILCNLHIVPNHTSPSEEFFQGIVSLLDKGSFCTASNCITLIYNAVNDHIKWKEILEDEMVLSCICKQINREQCKGEQIINILRTITKIIHKTTANKLYSICSPTLTRLIKNNNITISSHAFFCLYSFLKQCPQSGFQTIVKEKLWINFIKIVPEIHQIKATAAVLEILKAILPSLKKEDALQQIFPFLLPIICRGFYKSNFQIKDLVYLIVTIAIEKKVIPCEEIFTSVFSYFHGALTKVKNPHFLYRLVYIFSLLIINLEQSQFTCWALQEFAKIKKRHPTQSKIIELIAQTQRKISFK